jgi:FkbM family methyltransferase
LSVVMPDYGMADLILGDVFHADAYKMGDMAAISPKVVVDIGAHCGFFAVAAKRKCPSIERIVCIEPSQVFVECLKRNTENLGCRVDIVDAAIRHDDKHDLYVDPTTGMAMIYDPAANFCDRIASYAHSKVVTWRFDRLYDWLGLSTIDVLKIDCEGSEFDILPNIPDRIRRNVRYIVGEYHHPAGYPVIKAVLDAYYGHLKPECLDNPQDSIGEFRATP